MQIQLTVSDVEWKRFETFAHANSYSLEKAIARKLKFPVTKVTVGETLEAKNPIVETPQAIEKPILKKKPGRPKRK